MVVIVELDVTELHHINDDGGYFERNEPHHIPIEFINHVGLREE